MKDVIELIKKHIGPWRTSEVMRLVNMALKQGSKEERDKNKNSFHDTDYTARLIVCDKANTPVRINDTNRSFDCLIGFVDQEDDTVRWEIGYFLYDHKMKENGSWIIRGRDEDVYPYVYMILPEIKTI